MEWGVPGRARSSDPGCTAAYRDWLGHLNPIIARHQVSRGGSVLLYNVENEYAVNTDAAYMTDLQNQARAAGITVPITHNACCDAASWSSSWGSGPGAVQIPGVDDYPQSFECQTPDVWGPWGEGITERLRDDSPVFAAEFQAGSIDPNRAGYPGLPHCPRHRFAHHPGTTRQMDAGCALVIEAFCSLARSVV